MLVWLAYEDAYADWCAWAQCGGYSPNTKGWTPEQRAAHDQWYSRARNGIRTTMATIINAGATGDIEQSTLF